MEYLHQCQNGVVNAKSQKVHTDRKQAPVQSYLLDAVFQATRVEISRSCDRDVVSPVVTVVMFHRARSAFEGMVNPMTSSPEIEGYASTWSVCVVQH